MNPLEDNKNQGFKLEVLQDKPKTLDDYIQIRDGRLVLKTILQTENFIAGIRGVRMRGEGLDSAGGEIQGATIGPENVFSVAQGGTGASSLTGILKGNGTGAFTAIAPLAGTKVYYVSDSSGGAVNRKLTFSNGILVSET